MMLYSKPSHFENVFIFCPFWAFHPVFLGGTFSSPVTELFHRIVKAWRSCKSKSKYLKGERCKIVVLEMAQSLKERCVRVIESHVYGKVLVGSGNQ